MEIPVLALHVELMAVGAAKGRLDRPLECAVQTRWAVGIVAALVFVAGTISASAEDLTETRGRRFARANCAHCHAIGPLGKSPLFGAPPFRDLHERYPVEDLAEPLAEGILTGHPSMPQFRLHVDEISDLIAYMKSLER